METALIDTEQERFAEAFLPRREVEDWGRSARERVIGEIRERGLIERAWELEVDGYTVLTPDEVGGPSIGADLLEACMRFIERKYGARPDLDRESDRDVLISPFGNVQAEIGILGEDVAFEQALPNPAVLALVRYLLGESCALIHQSLMLKRPGPDHLPLHTDQDQTAGASPFPHYPQVANATWALTDYTIENGAICFVPDRTSSAARRPETRRPTFRSSFQSWPRPVPSSSGMATRGTARSGAARPACA